MLNREMTTPISDQLAQPHRFEATFGRALAWEFENMFNLFVLRSRGDATQLRSLIVSQGQAWFDNDETDRGHLWADFSTSALVDPDNAVVRRMRNDLAASLCSP